MKGKMDPSSARRGTQRHRKKTVVVAPEWSGAITPHQATTVPLPKALPRRKAIKDLWQVLLQEISHQGMLRAADIPTIEALCVAIIRHREAGMHIRKYGMMIERPAVFDESGNRLQREIAPTPNPFLRQERDAALLIDRLSQRFGLSPESRIRLDLLKLAGTSMLGALRRELDRTVADEMGEVVDGDVIDVDDDDAGADVV
jgi:P27 family predicted phage terminase small subunit